MIWRFGLVQAAIIPEVMSYCQIIEWVDERYDPDNRIVYTVEGQVFCPLIPEVFHKMIRLPTIEEFFC